MAYNDSGELPVSQSTYSLGGYTFELKVQEVHEPGEDPVVSVFAICRGPDGTRETQAVDYPVGTTIENWSVECNETEATVYAQIPGIIGNLPQPVPTIADEAVNVNLRDDYTYYESYIGAVGFIAVQSESSSIHYWISKDPFVLNVTETHQSSTYHHTFVPTKRMINGKPVYVYSNNSGAISDLVLQTPVVYGTATDNDLYIILYGGSEPEDAIIARFSIDIREAGTEDWDEPGDDGPPGTTLNVTVTGATAGSCTGTPADNETVKGYGDGGDGGYGGGGGAGASTVIIYEFATDIAESVQQEAISRGPGTGGPGGKGGKGGDGCILIFY